jgi:Ca2+-binding RTX toxin-like protein
MKTINIDNDMSTSLQPLEKANYVVGANVHLTGDIGILVSPAATVITNLGTISSSQDGIWLASKDQVIENKGTITAVKDGGVVMSYNDILNNSGTISGLVGVYMPYSPGENGAKVVNDGTITGSYLALKGNDNHDIVVNHGHVNGDISLGGGKDLFKNIGGDVNGQVLGGAGNDTYVVNSNTIDLVEFKGGGVDTVKASASYTLADNFENLFLTGKADTTAIGNSEANVLKGNLGSNILDGGDGRDHVSGGRGDDILFGGSDSDTFIFKTGDGKDVVSDFASQGSGHDVLDLRGVDGIRSFQDLQGHLSQDGADVVIHLGHGDTLTLTNVLNGELHASDFHF